MKPLAERMRPQHLHQVLGQDHLTGPEGVLAKLVTGGHLHSLILWGPPGVGKTTIAQLLAHAAGKTFAQLSAISSGVKDLRELITQAKALPTGLVLFIDEIHRFNKTQQDALLQAVEQGTITLIGATTENPSFEVNSALQSRCRVYTLNHLEEKDLLTLLDRALKEDEVLNKQSITLAETEALLALSGGDARNLLNLLETVVASQGDSHTITITNAMVQQVAQQLSVRYDKTGEQHYDIISAFIKSMRASDPNATVYWLARMLAGGEDPRFIARRMLILASEDVGLANPNALLLANTCFEAVQKIGMPEARIILSQTAVYLATSPKSNSTYLAIDQALANVQKTGNLPVPLHLRNAPTKLMRDLQYGQGYRYAHDHPGHFVEMECLPTQLIGTTFYKPADNLKEAELRQKMRKHWGKKYGY